MIDSSKLVYTSYECNLFTATDEVKKNVNVQCNIIMKPLHKN